MTDAPRRLAVSVGTVLAILAGTGLLIVAASALVSYLLAWRWIGHAFVLLLAAVAFGICVSWIYPLTGDDDKMDDLDRQKALADRAACFTPILVAQHLDKAIDKAAARGGVTRMGGDADAAPSPKAIAPGPKDAPKASAGRQEGADR